MEKSEAEEIEWNLAVSRVHAALARDSSVQGVGVESRPTTEMLIVLEPGTALDAATMAVIAEAQAVLPIRVVGGHTPRADLEQARRAIDAAAPLIRLPQGTKGVRIGTDWVEGKVRLVGDVEGGEAIVSRAGVDRRLVVVEDGPAFHRLPRR